jgi:hypothetical protein
MNVAAFNCAQVAAVVNESRETRVVAFRCPETLVIAMERAAASGLCSLSDVPRQAAKMATHLPHTPIITVQRC